MKQYTEYDVGLALEQIANGAGLNKVARETGIPRATLQGRQNGAQTHREAAQASQRLSPSQEAHLGQWVLAQAALGLPPTHAQLRDFA